MPPRKATTTTTTAPRPLPLQDHTITTSGRFPHTTISSLSARITSLGGTYTSKLEDDVTVLISSVKDYEEGTRSKKVGQAIGAGIGVVGLEWLEAVDEEQGKTGGKGKVEIDEYLMGNDGDGMKTEDLSGPASTSNSRTRVPAHATTTDTTTPSISTSKPSSKVVNPDPEPKPRRGKRTRPASPDLQPPAVDVLGKDGESPTKKLKTRPRGVDGESGDGVDGADGTDGVGAVKDEKPEVADGVAKGKKVDVKPAGKLLCDGFSIDDRRAKRPAQKIRPTPNRPRPTSSPLHPNPPRTSPNPPPPSAAPKSSSATRPLISPLTSTFSPRRSPRVRPGRCPSTGAGWSGMRA